MTADLAALLVASAILLLALGALGWLADRERYEPEPRMQVMDHDVLPLVMVHRPDCRRCAHVYDRTVDEGIDAAEAFANRGAA